MSTRPPINWRGTAKGVLAVLLGLLLAAAGLSSVSHRMHHHAPDQTNAGHLCLVCLLAKGQVQAADVPAILAIFLPTLSFFLPSLQAGILAVVDRRLSPSRAPPLPAVSF